MPSYRASVSRGSYTPLVTPFSDAAVDYEVFEASVDRQVLAGSDGVVVTGTTGEPTSLSPRERAELFRRAVGVADGRFPVAAGVGAIDQQTTFELTDAATAAGASVLLVVTPGFVKPSQRGLVEHFSAVAARTDLPVLLYNIPGRAGTAIAADTVARVVERAPNVVGIKHASPDLDLLTTLFARLGSDLHVFCGLESLSYPMLAVGASGLMSAVGNLFPEAVAALCHAVDEGDHARALQLHRELFAVNQAVFYDTNPVPLKAMMQLRNLGNGQVRPPLVGLDDATRARVTAVMSRYDHHEAVVGSSG